MVWRPRPPARTAPALPGRPLPAVGAVKIAAGPETFSPCPGKGPGSPGADVPARPRLPFIWSAPARVWHDSCCFHGWNEARELSAMKIFNTQTTILLKRSLDLLMRHNRNIAENVANLNVVDYKRKPTRFLDELSEAQRRTSLRVTDPRHIVPDPAEARPPEWERGPVEITREMADLAQNQIRYDFSARIMRRKFEGLTRAITGRIR